MKYFKSTLLAFIFTVGFFIQCSQDPTGPSIPENKKLSVFSVLSPKLATQTMYVGRTLTYGEALGGAEGDFSISNASIELDGPEGLLSVYPMDYNGMESVDETSCADTDFLGGTSSFNYILGDKKIQPGKTYNLTVESEGLDPVHAQTTVPGAFEITEVNYDPNLTDEVWQDSLLIKGIERPDLRVKWTKSEGAFGYLIDLVIMEYDIPSYLYHSRFFVNWPLDWKLGYSTFEIPFRQTPADFAYKFENSYQRGFLTRDEILTIPRKNLAELLEFSDSFSYRRAHLKRFCVCVHALDKHLYNFMAFQLAEIAKEQMIGQEIVVPDISNIKGGAGILGSSVTQIRETRLFEMLLQDLDAYRQDSFHSANKNEFYARRNIHMKRDDPLNIELEPKPGFVLNQGETVRLSWDDINTVYYLLVLKPKYLWFWPGNVSYLIKDNYKDISWDDFPYRDCEVEWYVKALAPNWYNFNNLNNLQVALSTHKSPAVAREAWFTDWSESSSFTVAPGDLSGFEDQKPSIIYPETQGQMAPDSTIQWSVVDGADAYILYLFQDNGEYAVVMSKEPYIKPPFNLDVDYADGCGSLTTLNSGENYGYQVCAVRIKSGALGFKVSISSSDAPPVLYPRYKHPSGILMQSQWSDKQYVTIQ